MWTWRVNVGAWTALAWLAGCSDITSSPGYDEDVAAGQLELSCRPNGHSDVLRKKHDLLLWSGSVGPEDAPVGGEPPECAEVSCDRIDFRLNLPPGTFRNPNRPGGLQVALRWPTADNTLHLFVYKGSELVAVSAGIIATAQSVFIPDAQNGEYTIWIAAEPSYNLDPSVPYEALAEVEFKPMIPPVRSVLPDLEFRQPRNIRFATPSAPFFEEDPPPGSTCFQSEMNEDGAQLCLRFDQVVANIGTGPLEVHEAIPKDPSNHELNAFQRVYRSNNSFSERPAGEFEFHDSHNHFHYRDFAVSSLWLSNGAGAKLGTSPVRSTRKVSFCIADIEIEFWGEKGDGPRTYFAPDCLEPQFSDENFDYLVVGLTNGWADVYDWFLPGQYVEVSGVPDGYYILESCADPDNKLKEVREDNNCIDTRIRLSDMSSPMPHVEMLEGN